MPQVICSPDNRHCKEAQNGSTQTEISNSPKRVNVLGIGISGVNMQSALSISEKAVLEGRKGYICVTGVHGVMESQEDEEFRRIQNASFLTVPDGMPMVWVGKLQGHSDMQRVYGPDFMLEICRMSAQNGMTHFFYGGKDGVAQRLKEELTARFPGLKVVGTYTPPFRKLNPGEEAELAALVERSQPDFFWVGLSTPKQERFMAQYCQKLRTKLMIGVGAAFDIHTGGIQDAPQWVKKSGLQWLHRLLQEPRRLWRRYLINNPRFVWNMFLQVSGLRAFSIEQ